MKKHGEQLISVIVPTRNGADQLRELLASLTIQTVLPDEILIIDSSSTDSTVDVARSYGASIQVIPADEFDHGGTRTRVAQVANGEILVFFTQDALPAHRKVIERLMAPIVETDDIVAAYGRQLPAFDADEIAAHLRLFNYPERSMVKSFNDRYDIGLGTVFISNSCAAYRKEKLADVGFFAAGLIFGEDTCAVAKLLKKGGRVAYVADAEVYHSHNYSIKEEFRRYFDIGVLHDSEKWLLETYGHAEGRGAHYVHSGISYLWARRSYSRIADFMVRVAVKYIAYQLGRRYRFLPRKMIPELSMHRDWWQGSAKRQASSNID